MPHPRVSVIVTVFDRKDYLVGAVSSVLGQSFDDLEVLVAQDGGTACLESCLRDLRDPRLRFLQHPSNLGVAGNVGAAWRETRGEFVALLNDDDRWEPGLLAALAPPLAAHPDLALAFCDHTIIDDRGVVDDVATEEVSARYRRASLAAGRHDDGRRLALVAQSIPTALSALLRKSAIEVGRLSPQAGFAYDFWLSYQATREGGAVWYEPARLAGWRRHRGMASLAAQARHLRDAMWCLERMLADPAVLAEHPALKRKLWSTRMGLIVTQARAGQRVEALSLWARQLPGGLMRVGCWRALLRALVGR